MTLLDPAGAGALVVAHRIAVNLRVALRLRAISAAEAEALRLVGAADLLPGPRPAGAGTRASATAFINGGCSRW
ncbi:hypothetical protein [Paractinoplanes hotanensis]|uniref:Uncharacterized protein n=1 Tax=Paractinoplanes hotanensis TaxID=2906497 RepID=A0ABT0XVY6_9ACTN|nr:hypothetical protein [Actinoplanes hotanensis]MCM4077950.1 hypothetical protein [Actinoplanes hotanensis]